MFSDLTALLDIMSMTSYEFSVAESEGVPDCLYGSRRDTLSTELECFNRLDVFNLGTINVYECGQL